MAEITLESLAAKVTELAEKNEKLTAELATVKATADGAVKEDAKVITPSFKPELAENKAKTDDAEFHFEVNKKQYKFIAGHVSVPEGVEGYPANSKLTAKAAQSIAELCKKLVSISSGQIKEVL